MPESDREMNKVVELPKPIDAAVMSAPDVKVMLGKAEVLYSKPAGVFSTRIPPDALMSVLFPSRIVIGPSVVHTGKIAFAALSARMLVPPVAFVMVTAAKAGRAARITRMKIR